MIAKSSIKCVGSLGNYNLNDVVSWESMLSSKMFIEGNFNFTSGITATLKADSNELFKHPKETKIILGKFATFPCLLEADVLMYVPEGMKDFTVILGREINKPVVHTKKNLSSGIKYDFEFLSEADHELAESAEKLFICEDVVTTLGSIAGVRQLLRPEQDVHSLAMLLRGEVDTIYQDGLTEHYLFIREIPTEKDEFHRRLNEEW